MDYKIDKGEQYAAISVHEEVFNSIVATEFETVARGVFREGNSNLIINLSKTFEIDSAGISMLKKINMLCSRELGLMVIVSDNDDFIDQLIEAKLRDVEILPTIEEAIDAVFMHEIENEFGGDNTSDYDEDELEAGGYSSGGEE